MGGLKVIGVGFPRTGTSSLKCALDQLGFHCYHMFEIHKHPSHVSLWLRVFDEKENREQLFEEIFLDYQATVDCPSIIFYRDLLKCYPDVKFILSLRNSHSWYESFRDTIGKAIQSIPCAIGEYISNPSFYKMIKKIDKSLFNGNSSDPQHVIEVFEQHNARIIEHIPAEQLLVYRVEQGWKPLCQFLNVPVPENEPFPRINDRKKMLEIIEKSIKLGWLSIFIFIGLILCTMWFFSH